MNKLNWSQRIARAKKKGKFSKEDKLKAEKFCTCSVGEKFKLENVQPDGMWFQYFNELYGKRKGDRIYQLGIDFGWLVTSDKVQESQQTYNEIQKLPVREVGESHK